MSDFERACASYWVGQSPAYAHKTPWEDAPPEHCAVVRRGMLAALKALDGQLAETTGDDYSIDATLARAARRNWVAELIRQGESE